MNVALLDPFQRHNCPEIVEQFLSGGQAVNCEFNHRGNLLAAGLVDGRCVIWDFDTKGIARVLKGPSAEITSLSWSNDSRRLLASSMDHRCLVWNVTDCQRLFVMDFNSPVLLSAFNPTNNDLIVACPLDSPPVLAEISTGKKTVLPISKELEDDPEANLKFTATFSVDGCYVLTGDSKGSINVIELATNKIVQTIKASTQQIKTIVMNKGDVGKLDLIVNAHDRKIRLYNIKIKESAELKHEFQEVVTNHQWVKCSFSPDGDLVVGGSSEKFAHKLYIWARDGGALIKILEMTKPAASLLDFAWHPTRSVIATVMLLGKICLWTANYQENWSAFAPDFKELEENVDYEEREDEFDENPLAPAPKKRNQGNEDADVDVEGIDADGPDSFFLPILVEEDEENRDLFEEEAPIVQPEKFAVGEKRKSMAEDKGGKGGVKRTKQPEKLSSKSLRKGEDGEEDED